MCIRDSASAINALATFYPDTTDISDNDQLDEAAKIIMAKARTIVSYIFRRRRDEPMLYPDYARGYVDDFLRMCFAVPLSLIHILALSLIAAGEKR